jgi:hypothetical protein
MVNLYTVLKAMRKGKIPFLLLCVSGLMSGNRVEAQTLCRPVSNTSSTGGALCFGMAVTAAGNAYDNDPGLTSYAGINNVVGLACYAEATFDFGQIISSGDTAIIYLGTGSGLLDLSLLSNVSVQAKNAGSNVGSAIALNNSVITVTALPGNTIATVKFAIPGNSNQLQVKVGGLISLLVNLRLYDIRLKFNPPSISGGNTQTVCSAQTTTFIASPAAGTTLNWYSSSTSNTSLYTGTNFTTPSLTTTTTYYIGVSRTSSCESIERTMVTVNINPLPTVTTTTPIYVCHGLSVFPLSYSSPVNNPDMYSITWNSAATLAGFSPVAYTTLTSTPLNIPKPIAAPTATYQGSFLIKNNNNCVNAYPFSLIVQDPPDPHATTTFQ